MAANNYDDRVPEWLSTRIKFITSLRDDITAQVHRNWLINCHEDIIKALANGNEGPDHTRIYDSESRILTLIPKPEGSIDLDFHSPGKSEIMNISKSMMYMYKVFYPEPKREYDFLPHHATSLLGLFEIHALQSSTSSCNIRLKFDEKLPFLLCARATVRGNCNPLYKKFSYHAKPDITLYVNDTPFILADIEPQIGTKDVQQLEVQLECTVYGIASAEPSLNKRNNMFGYYFYRDWRVKRYITFIGDDAKARFHKEIYNLRQPKQHATYVAELYNFFKHVKDTAMASSPVKFTEKLLGALKHVKMEGSLTSRILNSSDATCSDASENDGVRSRLADAGYLVDWDDGEFQSWTELPSHVLAVRDIKNGNKPLVVKVIDRETEESSMECRLLKKLKQSSSRLNHVITYYDLRHWKEKTMIIFENETPIPEYLLLPRENLTGLSQDLVEGVAFLHGKNIVHLDLKPGNFAYSYEKKRLLILDLGLTRECKFLEEKISRHCGTRVWAAPEIGLDDSDSENTTPTFSPIRADLWSCGKILQYFATKSIEKDRDFNELALLLINSTPENRLMLVELVDDGDDLCTSGRFFRNLRARGAVAPHHPLPSSVEDGDIVIPDDESIVSPRPIKCLRTQNEET